MGPLSQYVLFAAETMTLVIAILLLLAGILSLTSKEEGSDKIKIKNLNKDLAEKKSAFLQKTLDKKEFKQWQKELKAQKKEKKEKNNAYVIPFYGDITASEVKSFKEAINLVISVATEKDEVIIPIESPGGTVNGYGLGASQIARLREKNIPVTACIDKVAASGGYLMASVANKIIAAPFSIIGSIGVVAQMPNFHRFLKKHNVDVELITAGEHKRTLTMFGENTDADRAKFKENLIEIHEAFKESVSKYRPSLKIDNVANGDYWLGNKAFDLNLVDKIMDSDSYFYELMANKQVYEITKSKKQSLIKKLLNPESSRLLTLLKEKLGFLC